MPKFINKDCYCNHNYQKGYIALSSTIILSAIFTLLFIGMFALSVGGMRRISDKENSLKAISFANICIEKALGEIREDTDYEGNVTETFSGGNFCEIGEIGKYEDYIIFEVTGSYEGYQKKIDMEVKITETETERTIELVEWEEIK